MMTPQPTTPLLLNARHRLLLIILSLIGSLSFFDFLAFWQLMEIMSASILPSPDSQWQLIALFMAGYFSRPLGAWLVGRYADRVGRKSALTLNFLMLIVFTLMIALLPTHDYVGSLAMIFFITARLGQGMAFGSQFPILWSIVVEKLPIHHIGLGSGIITASAMVGGFTLMTVLNILVSTMSQSQLLAYGWRIPFFMSGIVGIGLLFLSKKVQETPIFNQHKTALATPTLPPFFSRKRWHGSLVTIVMSWLIASIIMVLIFLLPQLLYFSFPQYGSFLETGTQLSTFFMIIGCVFFGFLTDRTNVARVLVVGLSLLMISTFGLFYDLANGGQFLILSFGLMGFFAGIMGATPAIMVRLTPVRYRVGNVSLLYNCVFAGVGIGLPHLLGYATFFARYSPVVYLSFVCLVAIFLSFNLYYYPANNEEIERF